MNRGQSHLKKFQGTYIEKYNNFLIYIHKNQLKGNIMFPFKPADEDESRSPQQLFLSWVCEIVQLPSLALKREKTEIFVK